MKKHLFYALTFILCLTLCSCTWSDILLPPCNVSDASSSESVYADTSDVSIDNSYIPQYVLRFDNFGKLKEFFDQETNTDSEEVRQFLSENEYDINGAKSAEDIARIKNDLSDVKIPWINEKHGYKVTSLTYPEENRVIGMEYENEYESITVIVWLPDSPYIDMSVIKEESYPTEDGGYIYSTLTEVEPFDLDGKKITVYKREFNGFLSLKFLVETDTSVFDVWWDITDPEITSFPKDFTENLEIKTVSEIIDEIS